MKENRKTEVLVGMFLFVGMLMLAGIILQFGSVREWFRDTYPLRIAFPNASGIKESAPVYLGGSKVGKVSKHPQLNDTFSGVIIDVEIFDDIDIPADSIFAIGTAGLMGDALVEIKPSGKPTTQFIPHNYDRIIEGKVGGLSDLQNTAEQVSKKLEVVLDDIRSAMADVKEALVKVNKDALSPETVKHFKDSMQHLHQTMERVDQKVINDENAGNLKVALSDIKDAATSFKASAKNVETQTARLAGMFDKLEPALAKTDGVMASIKSAADSFTVTAKGISSNRGLLNALLNDMELKTDFKDLISNMKRSGVVFYKNVADKERAKQETPAPAARNPSQSEKPPIFRR
ncbi:MAG TPA: MlaD family protein [Prosthecobacter sp.]|nr:MlaD family protein [Prosthecobacter sp.]